jgi:hypothetical protein
MDAARQLQVYLKKVGIEPPAAKVYIELAKDGPCPALQLAKKTGLSRTQVYRYLDILQAYGLVYAEPLGHGTLFGALQLKNIEQLIAEREAQTTALRTGLNPMAAVLQQLVGGADTQTDIRHHYGQAGLKQATWNLTKAKSELRVFESGGLSFDTLFTAQLRERFAKRHVASYSLTNASHVPPEGSAPISPALAHYRHLGSHVLAITFDMYIYDQTIALLEHNNGPLRATEITDPALHAVIGQLHNALWSVGEPFETG